MRTNRALVVVIIVLTILIGVKLIAGGSSGGDDQAQISQALDESIQASKEGRPGGVMDKLSENLKVNDLDTHGNKSEIANYIKNNRPDIHVQNRQAIISGNEARIDSPVDINLNILGQTRSIHLTDATLIFRKESDHAYLVIPVQRWKLAEVQVPQSVIDELTQVG